MKLGQLETMRGHDLEGQMEELKGYLGEKSEYYRSHIQNANEKEFWRHFTIVHRGANIVYSWPHFLFNTVGRPKKKPE